MSAIPLSLRDAPLGVQLPGWYLVVGECEITQWTDEILDSENAGDPFEAFVHWVGVRLGKWKPATPDDDPDRIECCTGTVESASPCWMKKGGAFAVM